MSIKKKVAIAVCGLCALSGIGGVTVAGLIIYTRATTPPETPTTAVTLPAANPFDFLYISEAQDA